MMQEYRANKLRTALDIVRRIENWPTALALRLWRRRVAGRREPARDPGDPRRRERREERGDEPWLRLHH